MSLTAVQLLKKPSDELDVLFASSPAGSIPIGEATGTAIAACGTCWARLFAWFARWFLWQGKVFDPAIGGLRNRISVFVSWVYGYVFFRRGSRLITRSYDKSGKAVPVPLNTAPSSPKQ